MALADYKLYLKDNFSLVKTLVIKSNIVINSINNYLTLLGINIDYLDMTTWKYYKNISGEYFFSDAVPFASDKIMTVISLDIPQMEIVFNKENLAVHRATAEAYAYGTPYYKDLVSRFPEQKDLILGILNPVDMIAAIEAADGEVLWYDKTLVEGNEDNVIPKLQDWIQFMLRRWYIKDYAVTDDGYPSFVMCNLYAEMTATLLNIRLDNCKTNFVHSYHIKEYLASHGGLDIYMEWMTKKQALFLYRNIDYIRKNAGKQETFDWLVEKILSDRGIPLNEFSLRYNVSTMVDDLKPTIEFIKRPINFDFREGRNEIYTVDYVVDKEAPLAKYNPDIRNETIADIIQKARTAPYSEIPTKVLESTVIDTSEKGPFLLSSFLLNSWAYLSCKRLYMSGVTFTYPNTGDLFTVNARDAFILFLYVYHQSLEVEMEYVPKFTASWVQRDPLTTKNKLKLATPEGYLNDTFYDRLMAGMEEIGVEISIEGFHANCVKRHKRLQEQYVEVVAVEHAVTRAWALNAFQELYTLGYCEFEEEGTTYAQWLHGKGIVFTNLTRFDYELLAEELYIKALGLDPKRTSALEELHIAMIGIMQKLSSYSIQFIRTTILDPAIPLDNIGMRIGDVDSLGVIDIDADLSPYPELFVSGHSLAHVDHDNSVIVLEEPPSVHANVHIPFDDYAVVGIRPIHRERITMRMTYVDVERINGESFSFEQVIPNPELEHFPMPERLNALIINNHLNGFDD